MRSLGGLLLALIFGPSLALYALYVLAAMLVLLLPYLLILAVIVGITAGLAAGLVLRRRLVLPRRDAAGDLPGGPAPDPVRRPRGPGRRREE